MSTTANDTFAGQGVTPFLASIDKQSQQEDAATIAQRCRSEVLEETSVPSDPLEFFSTWLAQATSCNIEEPNAMCLATVDPVTMRPSARMVLLKEIDPPGGDYPTERGFVFYTNYESQKSLELELNPQCALTFFWKELSRSVRLEGRAEKVSDALSDAYFDSRPLGSRVSAIVSQQSRELPDRAEFAARLAELMQQAQTEKPVRPRSWGGWRVVPDRIEFWHGQQSRLHDRIVYTRGARRGGEGGWQIKRLQP